jgi:hypothetical protein
MSQTTDASSKALTGRDAFWIHPDGLRLSLVQLPRVPALVERNASEASMRELLGRVEPGQLLQRAPVGR